MPTALLILAAGKGTRMHSDVPKVLHKLGSAPLLAHAISAGSTLDVARVVIVAGHGAEQVSAVARELHPAAEIAVQEEQLGTGHAVKTAKGMLADYSGDVIVLYGDTPFVKPETLAKMQAARVSGASVVVLGFDAADPGRYGRLILKENGDLSAIVEAKDASPFELETTLCNSGVIAADANHLFALVDRIDNDNASGEYYLTDIIGLANSEGARCAVVTCDEAETLGINSRVELAAAEITFQTNARADAFENGATLQAPETVIFAQDTLIGRDVTIGPNVVFGPGVTIESGADIRAFCHLEGCHISQGATVGPFARLRPGAEIGDNSHIGNFVEIKKSLVGEGAKINHLSYIGDAEIGNGANVGAGTITCNYDGVNKHVTKIGARAFIGSNSALIAPVSIGDDAMTGSGSVIAKDVPDGDLALTRVPQVNKTGFALKLMDRFKAIKAKKLAGKG